MPDSVADVSDGRRARSVGAPTHSASCWPGGVGLVSQRTSVSVCSDVVNRDRIVYFPTEC